MVFKMNVVERPACQEVESPLHKSSFKQDLLGVTFQNRNLGGARHLIIK